MGKGSSRRIENTDRITENLAKIDWSTKPEPPKIRRPKTCGCPVGITCEDCENR